MRMFFYILLCVLCITSQTVHGQDFQQNNITPSIIKFKEIPISGDISNMVKELEKLGYTLDEMDNYVAILNGNFANENCEIVLYATPISKQMHSITVNFGKKSNWYSLKSKYVKIKDMIMEKYNVSPTSTEKFYSPYYEGDGYEMQALRNDKCIYFSTFKIGDDKIGVYIIENKVLLLYENSSNKALNKREEERNAYIDL